MLKSRALPTNKNNPCPVCGNTSGDCRTLSDDTIFCFGESSAKKEDKVNGFVCVKGANGHTATFKPDNREEWSEEQRQEWERRKIERQRAADEERRRRLENELPAAQRDKYYQNILEQLTLDEDHLKNLLDRGFSSDQIAKDGYKSVQAWQPVNIHIPEWQRVNFPPNLPGLLPNHRLNVHSRGILCPVFNEDGLIVAFQVRLDDSEDGRYRWLTSATQKNPDGATPHLNGELPIGIYEPVQEGELATIWITEGTSIKPSLARHRLNTPTVGASSGRFTSSPKTAKAAIKYLSTKYKTITLTFALDAGDILNRSGVPQRWEEQYNFFTNLGYECQFAWWGQVTKEDCDIDELTDFSGIRFIGLEEFRGMVKTLGEEFNTPPEEAKNEPIKPNNYDDKKWDSWCKSRKFTPTITIDKPEFAFPKIPTQNAIISVKAPLGNNKTGAVLETIKSSLNRAILLGSLNNLLYQTIARGNSIGVELWHIHQDENGDLVGRKDTHLAGCVNSIHRLDGYFDGVDLYIDEICSVISYILSGGTLGEAQAYVMKLFEKAIREANRVFILDANNNDIITNFISQIAPDKEVIKILNKAKPRPHHYKFVNSFNSEEDAIKHRDKSPLIKMMLDDAVNPFIMSDSRIFTNTIAELLTQSKKSGYAINSDTMAEDYSRFFLNNPDTFVNLKRPDFMALSPSCGQGVSITNRGTFTDKFTIFYGVLATNQQTQILKRLRCNDMDHYIFCPEFSTIKSGEKCSTPSIYRQRVLDRIALSMELADDNNMSMSEIIGQRVMGLKDDIWFELSCKLGAIDNYERDNLKKCLQFALVEQGDTFEEIDLEICKQTKEEFKIAKEKLVKTQALETHEAEVMDIKIARQLAKTNVNKETRRQIDKTFLLERLPEIDKTEFWEKDGVEFIEKTLKDRNLITRHQRFWFLTHFQISRKRSEVNWFFNVTNEYFYLGSCARDAHQKIWALQELNILQFLDGREYHKDSPEVLKLYQQARADKKINLALGLAIGKPTTNGGERIKLLRQCLGEIGIKLESTGQKLVDGKKHRTYTLNEKDFNSDIRQEILAATDRKYINYLDSETVRKVVWENSSIRLVERSELSPVVEPAPVTFGMEMAAGEFTPVAIAPLTVLEKEPEPEAQSEPEPETTLVWHFGEWKKAVIEFIEDVPEHKYFKAIAHLADGFKFYIWDKTQIIFT